MRCIDCWPAPCAAGYAWGEDGSDRCPASYFTIDSEAACKSAAAAAGKAYIGSETVPSHPSGCYFDKYRFSGVKGNLFISVVAFNEAAVGAGDPGTQLLCSGAALLARPAEAPRAVNASSSLG